MYFGKIESPKEKRKQAPGILGALLHTVFIGPVFMSLILESSAGFVGRKMVPIRMFGA